MESDSGRSAGCLCRSGMEGCEAQWKYLEEANADAIENLKNVGVTFYDPDLEELKDVYAAANTIEYDPAWVAAVESAKAAVQ